VRRWLPWRRFPHSTCPLPPHTDWYADFTLVEAAELLGLNPSTARGRYAAARAALKEALAEVPRA